MLKKILFLFIIITSGAFTGEPFYTFQRSVFINSTFFTTDNLGNFYVLRNDVLEKYDTLGNFYRSYNDKKLAGITSVDVSNPLKIVVFYREFSEVILLDNMLTRQADPIKLLDMDITQPTLVCFSFNGLWVYDRQNRELIQINNERKKIRSTGNLVQILNIDVQPNYMVENNNYLFLNDPALGVFIFDIYGTYYKTVPIKGLKDFKVMEEEIIYFAGNKLNSYNFKTLEEKIQSLPDSASDARIEKDKLFLLKNDTLNIYRVK